VFGSGGDDVAYAGFSHFIKTLIASRLGEAEKLTFDQKHSHLVSEAAVNDILEGKNEASGDLVEVEDEFLGSG